MPYYFLGLIWLSYLGYVKNTLKPGHYRGQGARIGYTMPLILLPLPIVATVVFLSLA